MTHQLAETDNVNQRDEINRQKRALKLPTASPQLGNIQAARVLKVRYIN